LGLSIGLVAALATRNHKSALLSAVGGILLFELALGLYDRFNGIETLYLGSIATLDVIVISSVVATLVLELISGFQESRERSYTQQHTHTGILVPAMEDAQDNSDVAEYNERNRDVTQQYPQEPARDVDVRQVPIDSTMQEVATENNMDSQMSNYQEPEQEKTQKELEEQELKTKYIGFFGDE
jgi:hypothetical protein